MYEEGGKLDIDMDYAHGGKTRQGYNDKDDESIAMRNRGRKMKSRKDRRDESAAMARKGGRRKCPLKTK